MHSQLVQAHTVVKTPPVSKRTNSFRFWLMVLVHMVSRVLPNAMVGRAFAQIGVQNDTLLADLPAMVELGLQKLYGF
jgi:hypothetical protein